MDKRKTRRRRVRCFWDDEGPYCMGVPMYYNSILSWQGMWGAYDYATRRHKWPNRHGTRLK